MANMTRTYDFSNVKECPKHWSTLDAVGQATLMIAEATAATSASFAGGGAVIGGVIEGTATAGIGFLPGVGMGATLGAGLGAVTGLMLSTGMVLGGDPATGENFKEMHNDPIPQCIWQKQEEEYRKNRDKLKQSQLPAANSKIKAVP